DPSHFLDCCDPTEHFAPPVLTKSNHAFFQGPVANGGGIDPLNAIIADAIGRDHQLEDTATTPVPALMTFATARAFPEHVLAVGRRRKVRGKVMRRRLIFHFAIRTNVP